MPNLGSPAEQQAARVIATTISEYTKKAIENVMAKYVFLAALRKKNRIRKARGGTDIKKIVKHKRAALNPIGDLPTLTFKPINRHQPVEIPIRGYHMVDTTTLWQKYQNSGPAAIINSTANLMTDLLDDFEFKIGGKFYANGYAQNPGVDWHGLNSLGDFSGAHTDQRIAAPTGNYMGWTTAFGSKGAWPIGTFPGGDGATGYHFYSPLIGLYKNSGYGGATADWKGQALRFFRQAFIWQELRGHKINTWLCTGDAFASIANAVEAKEQIRTERSNSNSLLINLGFGNVINFEGSEITYERGVPGTATTTTAGAHTVAAYGVEWDQIELAHWGPELFMSLTDFSLQSLADQYLAWTMSNLWFNPQAVVYAAHTAVDSNFPNA